jgi:hypothetical protein
MLINLKYTGRAIITYQKKKGPKSCDWYSDNRNFWNEDYARSPDLFDLYGGIEVTFSVFLMATIYYLVAMTFFSQ